jgi:RimJ/RimL family protein N-acetyltransferase
MNIPTLETERLILREWRDSDIGNYAKFQMDKAAARFVRPCETVGEAWRAMTYMAGHWLLRGYGNWSLERKDTGEHIGRCGHYFPMEWPEPEIGWCIYTEHQQQGFASEAAVAALFHAYQKLDWKTAISLIAAENKASLAMAKKLGATFETDFEYNGTFCAVYRHLNPLEFQRQFKEKPIWH